MTYNRPGSLGELLDAWSRISVPDRTSFLIVDNSPDGNARGLVESAAARGAIALRYAHEPAPGISAARNRALSEAKALGGSLLAFIDDDELPSDGWLMRLLDARARTGAEAVLGRVEARLPPAAPAWIARAGFFDIVGEGDGEEVAEGATCNALIDLGFVERHQLRFDPAFGFSGAEDTLFFRSIRARGGRLIFSDAALVHDIIPENRARLDWLRKRWRRTGNTDARIKMLEGASRVRIAVSGAARCVLGGAIALAGLAPAVGGDFVTSARGIRILERGLGHVEAAMGRTLTEYRASDGGAPPAA